MPQVRMNADLYAADDASSAQIRLVGYDLDRRTVQAGETLYLYLYWQALDKVEHDYKAFTQLLSAQSAIVAQQDKIAGAAAYPTSHWPLDALVRDRFLLTLDGNTPAGQYTLIAGLYRPGQAATRLRVQGSGSDHIVLARISVE
jgi:hypothetical protein